MTLQPHAPQSPSTQNSIEFLVEAKNRYDEMLSALGRSNHSPSDVITQCRSYVEFLTELRALSRSINAALSRGDERDPQLSGEILAKYVQSLQGRSTLSENERYLLETLKRLEPDSIRKPETLVIDGLTPPFFVVPSGGLAATDIDYAAASDPDRSDDLHKLKLEHGQLSREYDNADQDKLHELQGKLDRNLTAQNHLIASLRPNIYAMPSLLETAGLRALLHPSFCVAAKASLNSFDSSATGRLDQISIPVVDPANGEWRCEVIRVESSAEWNGEIQSEVLGIYCVLRDLVADQVEAMVTLKGSGETRHHEDLKRALIVSGGKFYPHVVAHEAIAGGPVQGLVVDAQFLPVYRMVGAGPELAHPLADIPASIAAIQLVMRAVVEGRASVADIEVLFKRIERSVGSTVNGPVVPVARDVVGMMRRIDAGDSKAATDLASYLDSRVLSGQKDFGERLFPAFFLGLVEGLAHDKAIGPRLSKRIHSFDKLREVLSAKADLYYPLIDGIQRRFSSGIAGYLGNREVVTEVCRVVEDFIRLNKEPELLEGLAPDEVIDNGVLLYGATGAGKTYLAQAIADEFGFQVERFSREAAIEAARQIKDYAGLTDEDLFMKGAEVILQRGVKAASARPVLILFDELEELAQDRRREGLSEKNAQRTPFMLRLISDIRTKHPGILLMATTNFLDLIDPAMLREGRFDAVIEVPILDDEGRLELIEGTLATFREAPILAEDELKDLVDISRGLIPASIKKAILGVRARQGAKAVEGPPTFVEIRASMERKAANRRAVEQP